MAEKKEKQEKDECECGMPLTNETRCGCRPDKCFCCCECPPTCKCGCVERREEARKETENQTSTDNE